MATTEIAPKPSVSSQPPVTPPISSTSSPFPQFIAVDDLKRLVVELIKEAQKAKFTDKVQVSAFVAEKDVPSARSRARASRLKYKIVDERYSFSTSGSCDQAKYSAAETIRQISMRL